jgi:hypothetical protein
MFSLQQYNLNFDYLLYAMLGYSVVFLYNVKQDLFMLFNNRSSTPDFYIGILLISIILWFYFSTKNKISIIDKTTISDADKKHITEIKRKLASLKFGIISGFFAIIIGTLALIDKIIPGFFITLIMTYYADKNI